MKLQPKKTAILVIDIQNDYCSPEGMIAKAGMGLGWIQETVERLIDFLEKIEHLDFLTVYIKKVMYPNKLTEYEELKLRKAGLYGICKPGTWGADFYRIRPNKNVVEKSGYSSFFETALNSRLRENSVQNVIVTGISTHVCVEATVIDAYQLGYNVFIVKELVATREEERKFHEMALLVIEKKFGRVIREKDFFDVLCT
jgi:ureidoacrylate peracid hydrolase